MFLHSSLLVCVLRVCVDSCVCVLLVCVCFLALLAPEVSIEGCSLTTTTTLAAVGSMNWFLTNFHEKNGEQMIFNTFKAQILSVV